MKGGRGARDGETEIRKEGGRREGVEMKRDRDRDRDRDRETERESRDKETERDAQLRP